MFVAVFHLLFGFSENCVWLDVTLPILLPFCFYVCVCAQSTHHHLPLWLPAWCCCCGRWCFCCCFSYKNQLYFLVTVSARRGWRTRYTPKATWLLDLIAIRAKYTSRTHTHTYVHMHILYTRTQADVTRAFLFSLFFFLFWVTLHSGHTHTHTFHFPIPVPIPISFYYYLLWVKMLVTIRKMKRRHQHQKAKLNCPKRSLVSAFVICFVFVSFFWIRWTNFLLFALSLFLLLLRLQNV